MKQKIKLKKNIMDKINAGIIIFCIRAFEALETIAPSGNNKFEQYQYKGI